MNRFLDLKRCEVNFSHTGNPETGILQTVGLPKATKDIQVPDLSGLTAAQAQAACTALNLGYWKQGGAGSTVTSQSPAATTLVAKGFAVNAIF